MKYLKEEQREVLKLIEKIGMEAISAKTEIEKKTLYSRKKRSEIKSS